MSSESVRKFEIINSPLLEAYTLFGAQTPIELSRLYTEQDQILFKTKEWDYEKPEQITNKVKDILENVDLGTLTEDEKEWRNEILWFWYHHAISCANWKRDKEKMKEFSSKALEYQGNNPNILTRLLFYLSHDQMREAQEWLDSKIRDADYGVGKEIIESYKVNGYF